MPGPGGRVVADRVAELHPGVRVLFVSGYTDYAGVQHGVLQEGVNFLQKPFSPIALAHRVREVLDSLT
jgi:two-component system cell cycle sensor histidine kinase/response regulator CckA